jgi:hypothetical protein
MFGGTYCLHLQERLEKWLLYRNEMEETGKKIGIANQGQGGGKRTRPRLATWNSRPSNGQLLQDRPREE